jgi:diaminopimelate epimerase
MKLAVTKMHGAGNDFVVLDATTQPMDLSRAQLRWLADRHVGVGADQILVVGPSPAPGVDFSYRIFNADGGEVQHCGNGARCFVKYVRDKGLTSKRTVRVRTVNAELLLTQTEDGQVSVDMGQPRFDAPSLPFSPDFSGVSTLNGSHTGFATHAMPYDGSSASVRAFLMQKVAKSAGNAESDAMIYIAIASMGNPHAVMLVHDVEEAPVAELGAWLREHPAFPEQVNVGFMQVVSRSEVRLRVFERGVGETLACGTGACAAVACGVRAGVLQGGVDVHTRGGKLSIQWPGGAAQLVMTGPAATVFETEVDLVD